MQSVLKCTTEELVVLVDLCGYHSVAKGIGESSLGEKSEDAWEAVFEGAVHQLMLKGVWDVQKASNNEVPLNEELQLFIKHFVQSPKIIRTINVTANESLLFHQLPNEKWLMHHVTADIIHEFFFIEEHEISKHVLHFNQYMDMKGENHQAFTLTDHQFDLLSKEENVPKLKSLLNMPDDQMTAFDELISSINSNNWTLHNTSLIKVDLENEQNTITEVLFHIPSTSGVWMLEYDEHLNVHVTNVDAKQFQEKIHSTFLKPAEQE
ncbi:hypothetical protein [Alkalihalophilus marmarensis]|uniref:Uncharacterized protein n=1 Tax=Alkalihalophilus marmarensis DSM 21297 TaxID=1188261 RepID=U6SW87_9BACI|nr:hypothetical protein [Alkalihalophilus marmarensis]ERN54911.1 hypothetical protein A33I_04350 [Alkalihalophilus marmarensis DSM 21297]